MKSGKIVSLAVLALLAAAASPAWAGTCSYDLPELLGDYSSSDFGAGPENSRTVTIETLFRTDQVQKAVLYLSGTISPGSVRGDGIQREPITVPMSGAFGFSLAIGDYNYLDSVPLGGVPFSEQREYTGPFNLVVIMPGEQCPFIFQINFGLGPKPFSPDLPGWIIPPPDLSAFTPWSDGLEFVTPITGTITEARLVLEGPGVPEPATLALLALGGLMALRRTARR
ncbi:MAG: PEP-CTERM sorting domain-containing protein [Planctomycetes bacterium]|nr:PEP-CTERM sorting domain-containing protein [Planctomycetota bacterium]